MNGETISQMDPIAGPGDVPYEPRHAAPEVNIETLEGQARAADEYRYQQMFRQFLAEYAAGRGPSDPDATPARKERFIKQQRKIVADAIEQQGIAQGYAMEKRLRIEAIFSDLAMYDEPYIGKHRKSDEEEQLLEETALAPADEGVGSGTPTVLDEVVEEAEEPQPEPPIYQGVMAESFEEPPEEPQVEEGRHRKKNWFKTAWYSGGAALANYFADPEKGRRRQAAAVLLGYAAVAAGLYLAGKGHFGFNWHEWSPKPPSAAPPAPPEVQPHTEQFYDTLQPHDYHGQAYEWGAAADSVGPPNATEHLQDLIQGARAQGAEVRTWGSEASGHWGISYVEVALPGGGSKTYYDTQHKLAIMQYLSDLNEYSPDANSR